MMPTLDQHAAASLLDRRRRAHEFVSTFLRGISPGDCFCAQSVMAAHPEVTAAKSAVLDLALEEFCRREMAGEAVDPEEFAARFPHHAASVLHLLEIRDIFERNGSLLAPGLIAWPEIGAEFLGCVLHDELGRGACSRVYVATQVEIGQRLVVLKVVPNHIAEVDALGRLSHPHIVPIHSVQVDRPSGLSAICMPWLGQATLLDLLTFVRAAAGIPTTAADASRAIETLNSAYGSAAPNRPVVPRRYVDLVCEIGRQVASALDYTHRRGFCHFDIKPTNVLLALDGTARLIDFNLATANNRQKSLGGTVPYMAPEQLRRHLHQPQDQDEGTHSDIFSLGVVLFELLTGRHPFRKFRADEDRLSAAAELLACQKTARPSLTPFNPDVDARLETLIKSCLAYDPRLRPDAARLRAELSLALSPRRRVVRWMRRNRRAILQTALIAAAISAGGVWFAATREPESIRQARLAAVRFEQGDFVSAEENYDRALAADPDRADWWIQRGRCRLARSKFEDATADFDKAWRLAPDGVSAAYVGYGLCLARRDLEEALRRMDEAWSLGVRTAGLENNRAYCHLMLRHYDPAEQAIERCLALEPPAGASLFISARLKLANASRMLAREQAPQAIELLQQARTDLQQAVAAQYESSDVYLYSARAEALLAKEQNEPEAELLRRMREHLVEAFRFPFDPSQARDLVRICPGAEGLLNQLQEARAAAPALRDDALPLLDPFPRAQRETLSAARQSAPRSAR